jgi:hypothetical protein
VPASYGDGKKLITVHSAPEREEQLLEMKASLLEMKVSCHEMKDTVFVEYKASVHYQNASGVRGAESSLRATRFDEETVRLTLVSGVANAYFQVAEHEAPYKTRQKVVAKLASQSKQTASEFEKFFFEKVRPSSLLKRFETPDEIADTLQIISPNINKKDIYRLLERAVRKLRMNPLTRQLVHPNESNL